MWIDKYAPKSLDQVVGNRTLLDMLSALCSSATFPHLILYGPTGVGKTSIINIIVESQTDKNSALFFSSIDDRSIQNIRDRISTFAPRKASGDQRKILVFEQADQLGEGVQQMMRTTMETYSKTTSFVFICDKLHGIIETIQSRCMVYKMAPVSIDDLVAHQQRILHDEAVEATSDEALRRIALLTNGDVRQCVNYLETCAAAACASGSPITVDVVNDVCVFPYLQTVQSIVESMLNADAVGAMTKIHALHSDGYTSSDIIMCLNTYFKMNPVETEKLHMACMKEISIAQYRITKANDSVLQLCGMVCRIMKCV